MITDDSPGERRLGHRQPGLLDDLGAPGLAVPRHELHGREPVRVGERGKHPR
jgi:hypothetical protein